MAMAAVLYFAVPRLFDARRGALRGVRWLRAAGGGRAKGLFGVHGPGGVGAGGMGDAAGERAEELEFGFCFDVSVLRVLHGFVLASFPSRLSWKPDIALTPLRTGPDSCLRAPLHKPIRPAVSPSTDPHNTNPPPLTSLSLLLKHAACRGLATFILHHLPRLLKLTIPGRERRQRTPTVRRAGVGDDGVVDRMQCLRMERESALCAGTMVCWRLAEYRRRRRRRRSRGWRVNRPT